MGNLLPQQVPPPGTPVLDSKGNFNVNWWLFFVNLSQIALGNSGTTAAPTAVQTQLDVESDADSTDPLSYELRISNLERQVDNCFPDVANVWIPDELLPDPVPRAQAVEVITVGASPFVYTALAAGTAIVAGGTVSTVAVSRDGTTFYPTSVGSIPLSRLDQLKVTYSVLPTLTYFSS